MKQPKLNKTRRKAKSGRRTGRQPRKLKAAQAIIAAEDQRYAHVVPVRPRKHTNQ